MPQFTLKLSRRHTSVKQHSWIASGFLWITLDYSGLPRITSDYLGLPRITPDYSGLLRITLDYPGLPNGCTSDYPESFPPRASRLQQLEEGPGLDEALGVARGALGGVLGGLAQQARGTELRRSLVVLVVLAPPGDHQRSELNAKVERLSCSKEQPRKIG